MQTLFFVLIVAVTFFLMEFMAWFTHKYVMHGFMWHFHEDHHVPHEHSMEKNDLFFIIYAIPSMLLMFLGSLHELDYRFFIGLGILLYGIAYFLVHDVFIHQRIKWLRKTDNRYFRAIRKAHKIHHKSTIKQRGECFGMLFVPRKYYKEAKLKR